MAVVSGRVAFDTPSASMGGDGGKKLPKEIYFSMRQDGLYHLTLLGEEPVVYFEHWVKNAEGALRTVRCATRNCKFCEDSNKLKASTNPEQQKLGKDTEAKQKFIIEAYLLADCNEKPGKVGRPVLFEMTKQTFKGIAKVRNTIADADMDLKSVVLKITRNKHAKPDVYSVGYVPKTKPYTDEQKKLIDEFFAREIDLVEMYAAPTNEENLKRLGFMSQDGTLTAPQPEQEETPYDQGDDAW